MSRIQRIQKLLSNTLQTTHLQIDDESSQHRVPVGAESHMKVIAVSDAFSGHTTVARHRMVYALLEQELSSGLHALSLFLYTPKEWTQHGRSIPASPACSKRNKT